MVTLFDEEKIAEIHDYHVAQAGRKKGRIEEALSNIKNLMETTGWTSDAAMNALKIPANERPKYAELLEEPRT